MDQTFICEILILNSFCLCNGIFLSLMVSLRKKNYMMLFLQLLLPILINKCISYLHWDKFIASRKNIVHILLISLKFPSDIKQTYLANFLKF